MNTRIGMWAFLHPRRFERIRAIAIACVLAVLLADAASFMGDVIPHSRVSAATTTPLLLITDSTNAADPFGPYLGEILRAEGLPTFSTVDLSTLSDASLTGVGVLLLGPTTSLTSAQVTTLTNYVQGGGQLIAMHAPASLTSLFGVTSAGTTNEGYIKIGPSGLGNGFNTTTLQIHSSADNYSLTGATSIATLYTNGTSPTSYAAVTITTSGQGQAMLWSYDLAQSVVYTRQSNPSRAAEHDGISGYRMTDLFAGYVDLNDVPIPQADEQQRLLAKAIEAMSPIPLPHLWYFPQNAGTMLILTGDAHGNPTSYYTNELSSVQKYGGHISFYLSQAGQPAASDVAAWKQAGHGVGIHPYANPSPPTNPSCGTTDGNGIGAGIANDLTWFNMQFGTAPSPTTRVHTIAWQCWSDSVAMEANAGLQMDTDAYAWGPWLKKPDATWAHGFINGSGLPMKMVDATGHIYSLYQQGTSLIDEQLLTGISSSWENLSGSAAAVVSQQLIDASLTGGNYAALMTQFHVDYYSFPDSTTFAESTMSYAKSKGVPIWSADDWLRFTKARAGAAFGTPTWDGQTLTFTVTVPAGPDAMPVMVPLAAGGSLTGITVDGAAAAYQSRTVKGAKNGIVMISSGAHTVAASYTGPPPDITPPTVSLTTPANGATVSGSAVTVSATASDTTGVTSVQFMLDGSTLGNPVASSPYSITWDTTKVSNGSHTLSAQASDAAGNVGVAGNVTLTVTNPPQFSAVTASNVQSTTATVSWTTDKQATSQVEYGTTTAYGTSTPLDTTLVTSHIQNLTGLIASTVYHYRVRSTDGAGIAGVSGDFTFSTAGPGPTLLVGDQNIEVNQDNNPAGAAEAFQYTALTTGNVDKLFVYVDGSNTATQVIVGLYTNSPSDNPGTLLTQATIVSPAKGAWNNVTLAPTAVTAGTKYWIALLGPVGTGTVQFRDTATGGKTQASAQTNLSTLPGAWSTGGVYANSPLSAYAVQSNGAPPPPDTTPPTVSLTAPANGASVSGTTVTVSATASDNVGVASVQFLLDGNALGNPVTTAPYSNIWDTTKATNGGHILGAQAKDGAGNVGTATTVSVTVANAAPDTTPPTVSLTAPTDGATVSGTAVTISATASDNVGVKSVQFMLDGNALGNPITTAPYTITWDTTKTTNNSHTLSAQAKDAAGNSGTATGVSVSVANAPDSTPPTVSLTAPANGVKVSGASVTVSATASDNVGVASVQFLLDGNALGNPVTTAPYSNIWDTTKATNGGHILGAQAKDGAGNVGTATTVSVTVANAAPDTTPPTVSLTAPTDGATVSGTAVTISATASDNVGVKSVQFMLDGNALGNPITTAPYTITWDTTKTTNNSHTLSAQAKDAAGNSGTATGVSVSVANAPDSTPPTVSLTAPANGVKVSGASVTVSATASDNVGVASVQFLLDGNALGNPVTTAPYSNIWDTTKATNGGHILGAQAKDGAGNVGTATTVSVTVANPPVITAVGAGGVTTISATITWTTSTAATSQVDYGTSTAYGSSTTLDPSLVISHSQPLSGLTASTTYHYRVHSTDAQGNAATSGDFIFATPVAAGTLVVGDKTVEGQVDNNPAGTAEAFQYTAAANGAVTKLTIYIDSSNTASQVVVGLYTDAAGKPGTLLTQATIVSPNKGAWNTATVPNAMITSGTLYWIAVLTPVGSGTVQFRDKAGGGKTQASAQTNLAALPATWTAGASYTDSPMSAYATP